MAVATAAIARFTNFECRSYNPGDSRHQRRGGSTELFAAASFSRSTTRRTSRPTPFQRRGCGLPVDLLGPCGAFTEPCRPLAFPLSPAGTPESKSFSPDVLSHRWLAKRTHVRRTEAGVELTCWSEDPVPPWQFPATTGLSPRTPSVVFETRELSPTSGRLRKFYLSQPARTVSPSLHPRPYVRQATDFLPASALFGPPLDLAIDR